MKRGEDGRGVDASWVAHTDDDDFPTWHRWGSSVESDQLAVILDMAHGDLYARLLSSSDGMLTPGVRRSINASVDLDGGLARMHAEFERADGQVPGTVAAFGRAGAATGAGGRAGACR